MASGSGGNHPEPGGCGAECESCRSAPGIPFCRVEWSFLCTGCAAVVHANNWIIAVPPNPNPNSTPTPTPTPTPYHYPFPHPFPNPNLNPSAVVQLSSSDDSAAACGGGRKRRRGGGKAPPPLREESVMRYREKRKSRKFEKTVRYESRKVYAEQRPRVDGKFARPVGSSAEGAAVVGGDESGLPDVYFQAVATAGEAAGQDESGEGMVVGGEELGMLDVGEELRLQ